MPGAGANNHILQLVAAVLAALLVSGWWHSSAERQVLAQIRVLLAENAQLRAAAEARQEARSAGPAPAPESCRSSAAACSSYGVVPVDDGPPDRADSRLQTFVVSVLTTAYLSTLLHRLCLEWQLFQQLRGRQPFLEELCSFARYRVDLWVSNTACWQEISLIGTSTGVVLMGGWVFHFVSGSSLGQSMFKVWIFLVDAGAHGDLDEKLAWFVGLLVTICGMLVFALLISVLTERLQQFLEAMRKGHSRVLCSGHVLILGWSDKIPTIIEELAEANSSEGGGMIVILAAEKQKTEMEEEIQFQLDNSQSVYRGMGLRGTKWVVRSGNPMLIADLQMVSVELAKSIIILVDNTIPPSMADEKTLRTLLGLAGLDYQQKERKPSLGGLNEQAQSPLLRKKSRRRSGTEESLDFARQASRGSEDSRCSEFTCSGEDLAADHEDKAPQNGQHIVVELTDIDSVPLVEALGSQRTEIVVGHDMAGQLLIQGSRDEGLSRIFETIVGFSGPEFYIEEWPTLVGRTFGEAAFCFAAAVPCGLVRSNGRLEMNPPSCCRLEPGDRIVVLAEDNDTYTAEPEGPLFSYAEGTHMHPRVIASRGPEHILICGWRRDLGDMITELEAAVEPGSTLTLMSLVEEDSRERRLSENCRVGHTHLKNLTLKHCVGDPTGRKDLEQLPLETYDSVIVVADELEDANAVAADGHAIATMLLILDIRRSRPPDGKKDPLRVTSELRDTRTRNLIQATGLSDYVMSQNIIASAIANIAESREVNRILREILASRGTSLYLKPSTHLADPCEEVTFWELTARARDRKEILLGYQVDDEGTIIVNPLERDKPVCWEGRSFIIMARAPGPRTKGGSQDEGSSEA